MLDSQLRTSHKSCECINQDLLSELLNKISEAVSISYVDLIGFDKYSLSKGNTLDLEGVHIILTGGDKRINNHDVNQEIHSSIKTKNSTIFMLSIENLFNENGNGYYAQTRFFDATSEVETSLSDFKVFTSSDKVLIQSNVIGAQFIIVTSYKSETVNVCLDSDAVKRTHADLVKKVREKYTQHLDLLISLTDISKINDVQSIIYATKSNSPYENYYEIKNMFLKKEGQLLVIFLAYRIFYKIFKDVAQDEKCNKQLPLSFIVTNSTSQEIIMKVLAFIKRRENGIFNFSSLFDLKSLSEVEEGSKLLIENVISFDYGSRYYPEIVTFYTDQVKEYRKYIYFTHIIHTGRESSGAELIVSSKKSQIVKILYLKSLSNEQSKIKSTKRYHDLLLWEANCDNQRDCKGTN